MRPRRIIGTCIAVLAAALFVTPAAPATATHASIEVTQSRGTNALTEGDAGYVVSISLSAVPTAPVVVALGGTGLVATPSTLTFSASTARVPQPVVVTAVDDALATDGGTRTLVATSTSADHAFDLLSRTVDLLVLDDDGVALALDPTGSDTTVTEAGATDTVLVRLGTRPQQPVSVFVGGAGIEAVPDMVVVRPDQWNTGLPVTIVARDDTVENGRRSTSVTARTVSPDTRWTGITTALAASIIDDDDLRAVRGTDPGSPPDIPVSRANRTPAAPTFSLAPTWPEGSRVVLRFRSLDADGDAVRYRVFSRTHPYGDRAAHAWQLATETTSARFDSTPIAALERRCFRIEAVDPMGAAASTTVSCTHGLADAATVAATYGWQSARMRGASGGTVSEPTTRARLVYFTHTGSRAELTFIRCRTCASIRMVDPSGRTRIIPLSGSGRLVVSVPLYASGRRTWGFYVQGSGTVLFDTFAVIGAS